MIKLLLLSTAFAIGIGIFCRLNKLDIRQHKLGVILFNVGLLGGVLSAGQHAWTGKFDLQDACIMVASACWILVSYKTWQDKPPEYVSRS